jgi:hypothetical protein
MRVDIHKEKKTTDVTVEQPSRPWTKEPVYLAVETGSVIFFVVIILIRGEQVRTPVVSVVNTGAVAICRRTEDAFYERCAFAVWTVPVRMPVKTAMGVVPGQKMDTLAEGSPDRVCMCVARVRWLEGCIDGGGGGAGT